MMEWMKHGTPFFDNWAKYAGPDATAEKVADLVAYQKRGPRTGSTTSANASSGRAISCSKGIMHPDGRDPRAGARVDGIMVSNHGARSSTSRHRHSRCCRRSATPSADKMT